MTHVLLIEDDQAILLLTGFTLESEGFNVSRAANGTEGLEMLRQNPPDIIVCDIMMPDMSGLELREKLLEDPELSRIPFIFLTARAQTSDFMAGQELAVDGYITKPFEPDILAPAIRGVLEKRKK
jgi:CheY-like chemotaxis protein